MTAPSIQPGREPGKITKIHSLQALRALAALLVVADHALLDLVSNDPLDPRTRIAWLMGESGVYTFFVISGFIMVHISWNDFGKPGAAFRFLHRRLLRIVPLYWVATITALVFHRLAGTHGMDAGGLQLVQSLLFIPYRDVAGQWMPVLAQGWTLDYEMMFYAIFAATLCIRRAWSLPVLALIFCALTVSRPVLPNPALAHLAAPIVLWFILGVALGALWHMLQLSEPIWLVRSAKDLGRLGDASYATYLVHGIALTLLLRAWSTLLGPPSLWFVAVSLAVATLVGYAVHTLVEMPLLRLSSNTPGRTVGVLLPHPTRRHATK